MGERGNRFAAPRYKDPALDKLIDDFTQTADAAKQKEIMFEIQDRVGANQTIIPVFNNPTWYEYSTAFPRLVQCRQPGRQAAGSPDTPERLLRVVTRRTANQSRPPGGALPAHPLFSRLCRVSNYARRGRTSSKRYHHGIHTETLFLLSGRLSGGRHHQLPATQSHAGDPVSVMFARPAP